MYCGCKKNTSTVWEPLLYIIWKNFWNSLQEVLNSSWWLFISHSFQKGTIWPHFSQQPPTNVCRRLHNERPKGLTREKRSEDDNYCVLGLSTLPLWETGGVWSLGSGAFPPSGVRSICVAEIITLMLFFLVCWCCRGIFSSAHLWRSSRQIFCMDVVVVVVLHAGVAMILTWRLKDSTH